MPSAWLVFGPEVSAAYPGAPGALIAECRAVEGGVVVAFDARAGRFIPEAELGEHGGTLGRRAAWAQASALVGPAGCVRVVDALRRPLHVYVAEHAARMVVRRLGMGELALAAAFLAELDHSSPRALAQGTVSADSSL